MIVLWFVKVALITTQTTFEYEKIMPLLSDLGHC